MLYDELKTHVYSFMGRRRLAAIVCSKTCQKNTNCPVYIFVYERITSKSLRIFQAKRRHE